VLLVPVEELIADRHQRLLTLPHGPRLHELVIEEERLRLVAAKRMLLAVDLDVPSAPLAAPKLSVSSHLKPPTAGNDPDQ
jgi:hypothetical protein